jgi:hypothetical protein
MRKALLETAKEPVIAIGMLALVVDHSAPAINAVPDSAAAVHRLVLLGGAAVSRESSLGLPFPAHGGGAPPCPMAFGSPRRA